MKSTFQRRAFLVLMVLCVLVWVPFSCTHPVTKATADINPLLEMTPPIAKDVTVSILSNPTEEGNILVTARLDTAIVKSSFHALMVNDEKLVLRDDGVGGDATARDGVFSIVIKEDIAQVRSEFSSIQKDVSQLVTEQKNIFKWVNRSAVSLNEKIRNFKNLPFDTATILQIDPDILFAAAPIPALNDRSLMVTDIGVVEDQGKTFNPCTNAGVANGAWTFGKLITDMANTPATGVAVEDFVKDWLDKWMNLQTPNGDGVQPRTTIFNAIIVPWIIKSNPGIIPASITQANWKTKTIQVQFAPFKLLAIVNRVDLRGNSGYGISNAGEGRFVFGALNSTCTPLTGPGKFTVIFEYGVPKKTCAALKAYAQQWFDLKNETPGTPAYNTKLLAITDQFTAAGAGGTKPNGSSLNQLRTNELAIGNPWELREFTIDAATHLFKEATVKQEPAKIFNRLANPPATAADQTTLANYVNTNEVDIVNNRYTVPDVFSGANFLGGKAHTETPNHFWDGSATAGAAFINNSDARHVFSINTCSGCHGGEGKTSVGNLPGGGHNAFLHISPQAFGTKATLSAFLTGDPSQPDGLFRVNDPAGRLNSGGTPIVWTFNDLARRNVDLQELVTKSCRNRLIDLIRALRFRPVHMTH